MKRDYVPFTLSPEPQPLERLRATNKHLRELVVSLSAALLRNAVIERPEALNTANLAESVRLMGEAEECFRSARIPGVKEKVAEGLEVTGYEFMAKAVEIETILQQQRRKK